MIFLENYDMRLGALLTRGTDIWLNNPRRPLEASGTSGMKAAMNGVPNLSILDGWWPEGCEHGVTGWKIGDPDPTDDPFDEKDEARVDKRDREILHRRARARGPARVRAIARTWVVDHARIDRDVAVAVLVRSHDRGVRHEGVQRYTVNTLTQLDQRREPRCIARPTLSVATRVEWWRWSEQRSFANLLFGAAPRAVAAGPASTPPYN